MVNNWHVITGGPSSGKTTLLAELAKLGYPAVPEMARLVIDDGFAAGLSLELALEAAFDPTQEAFFDRGMQDSLAYYSSYGWQPDKTMQAGMSKARYKTVFLLEPLDFFHNDGARTEDHDFTLRLTTLLEDAYYQYDMPPVRVPVLSPAERAQFIIDYIKAGKRD
jgi:predicted ATPase